MPADLAPYRPTPEAVRHVRQTFEKLGFKVYPDALGLTLSIEASPSLFSKHFKVSRQRLSSARSAIPLEVPAGLNEFIDSITTSPRPRFV